MTTIRLFESRLCNEVQSSPIDWSAVYVEQLPRVYNFFLYQVNDEMLAEDLTAVTFQRAWQSRERYRTDVSAFTTWIFSIARRVAADHFRRTKKTVSLNLVAELPDDRTPDDLIQKMDDIQQLATLLMQLSRPDQELIALKYGGGLTNRTIALLTGMSESNVGTTLHRIVRKLRERWEE